MKLPMPSSGAGLGPPWFSGALEAVLPAVCEQYGPQSTTEPKQSSTMVQGQRLARRQVYCKQPDQGAKTLQNPTANPRHASEPGSHLIL